MSNQTIAEQKAIRHAAVMLNAAHNPPAIKYPHPNIERVAPIDGVMVGFAVGILCVVAVAATFYSFIF